MPPNRGGANPAVREDDGRLDNPGRPTSPYIEREGRIVAVKLQDGLQPDLELLAVRRHARADQVIAAMVGEAVRDELGGIKAALDRLERAITMAAGQLRYEEASALWLRADALVEQLEFLVCATPDYPGAAKTRRRKKGAKAG